MQGHIHKRVHYTHDGRTTTTWYVVVDRGRDRNGKRRQKWHGGFRTRKEAEAARARIVNEINTGTYVAPTGATLEEYVRKDWLPTSRERLKATTWDSYSRNLELHVLPRMGSVALHRLSPTSLNSLYAELLARGRIRDGNGLSPRTVAYIHTILRKALQDAVDARLIPQNPADGARPPRPEKGGNRELRFWTPEELRQFLDHTRDSRLYPAWHLAAMTGMRRGEVLGLRWSDVDIERRRLTVRHSLVSVAYEVHETTPKSHRARVVDLDTATVDLLDEQRTRQSADREAWQEDYEDSGLVFSREDGSPIHPDSLSKQFEAAVTRSGVPRIRLHDLRHTHATIALQAGVPVKVISERLGHESAAFTLQQYAHVMPGMQADAAARVADLVLSATGEIACTGKDTNICSISDERRAHGSS